MIRQALSFDLLQVHLIRYANSFQESHQIAQKYTNADDVISFSSHVWGRWVFDKVSIMEEEGKRKYR